MENVVYVLRVEDAGVVLTRAFTATLGHVVFSGSMGFFFGLAKLNASAWRSAALMLAGIASATLFHGLYDIFLFRGDGLGYLSLLGVLPLLMVLFGVKVRWARARSEQYHARSR